MSFKKHLFLMRHGNPSERIRHYNDALHAIHTAPTEDLRAARAHIIDPDPDIREINKRLHNELKRRDYGMDL